MEFRILGPFEAADDDGLLDLAGGKQRALLAVLLLHADRVVSIDLLVDELWGEEVPETAPKMVQILVSQLRKQLPAGILRTRTPGYLVALDGHKLDLRSFEELVAAGREALREDRFEPAAATLREALALWRGRALAEFSEPFAQLESDRLEEHRLGCLEDRVDADLSLGGRHHELVAELDALVRRYPQRERLLGQLMVALYRSGRHAEALDSYQAFRSRLDEELGMEPSQALRELQRRILQQDPALEPAPPEPASAPERSTIVSPQPAARPHMLRDPPVGRDVELRSLERILGEALGGHRRVAFVTGEAGTGKTTLVAAFLDAADQEGSLLVARGQCIDNRGPGEPYLPVLDAIGRLGRSQHGELVVETLRRFAPTWLVQLPSLVGTDEREWVERRAIGVTSERMLREMMETLDAMSAERPLVLVLEDLHWSDPSTLDLVDAIARRPDPSRLLLIGTYRPGEEGAEVRQLERTLRLRNLCSEIAVGPLTSVAVGEYLERRLPGHDLPDNLPDALAKRTRGTPLFIEKLVDSWLDGGSFERNGDSWRLAVSVEQLRAHVPETVRELIAEQLRVLEPSARELLEAASVAGSEFSVALAAAGAEVDDDAAETALSALEAAGFVVDRRSDERWPDCTVTTLYAFAHDLVQEVLYDGIPAGRRARLHSRLGDRLEAAYGARSTEVAALLAWHYAEAQDAEHAVAHLLEAAQQAFGRGAGREALRHIESALEVLPRVGDDQVRRRLEASAHLMNGPTRILVEGWGSERVEESLLRALELTRELGEVEGLGQALFKLAAVYEVRGQYGRSAPLIEEALGLPREAMSRELLVDSHELFACSLVHQGRHQQALEHADRALGLSGDDQLPEPVAVFGESPGVSAHVWGSLALWHLGKPDSALARAERAVAAAALVPRAYARGMANINAAIVNQCLRRPLAVRRWAEAGMQASLLAGYPYWHAVGSILRGWARAIEWDSEAGIAELRESLAAARSTGARLDDPYFLTLLADAQLMAGDVEAGLAAVDEALQTTSERSFFCEPELHRLRGELLRRRGDVESAVVELERSVSIARQQGATAYELRAATGLARLRRDAASGVAVASVLSVYTEGQDTLDVEAAHELLAELGVAVPAPTTPPVEKTRLPGVRYARSGDLSIAYQVTGDGAIDVLLVPGFVSHLEEDWKEPRHAHFLERLGASSRLIRFDKRGTGLSDRPPGIPDLETRMDDLRAVMDAAGSEKAVVFGYSEGGPLSVLFAAAHPERVAGLILYGAYVKRSNPDDDYPWAPTGAAWRARIEELLGEWGFESQMKVMCPSADDEMARWWGARCRAAASPGAVKALMEMNSSIDVRHLLDAIHVPALVVHRGTDFDVDVEEGRYIARRIPGARFVELEGADHFVAIDPDQILDVVEPFVESLAEGELSVAPIVDNRVLVTVMLTDIVDSTATAMRLGDSAWASLLERHNRVVREELVRYSGEEIDAAGDGFLAVFEGPARAIRCGQAICKKMPGLGLEVRVGVHTGEVERVDDAVRGIAVHLTARIAATAPPGEVFVSATTRDLVAGSTLAFVDHGEHTLRGVGEPRRLFAVTGPAAR